MYLCLSNQSELPELIELKPYKCIVLIEEEIDVEWQKKVSDWLVKSGCRYMMTWGLRCSSWDDSVDIACLEAFNYQDTSEESLVVTTWHEDETLEDVFWFAKHCAFHETLSLEPLILHISATSKEKDFKEMYHDA